MYPHFDLTWMHHRAPYLEPLTPEEVEIDARLRSHRRLVRRERIAAIRALVAGWLRQGGSAPQTPRDI